MTDSVTLFCLVDGKATPFSVKMSYNGTVDELKKELEAELAPQFNDATTKDLALWRVSIPVANDDDEDFPVFLNNIHKDNKKRLKSVLHKVTDIFGYGAAENTIHIIVQWPPPSNAGVLCSRWIVGCLLVQTTNTNVNI